MLARETDKLNTSCYCSKSSINTTRITTAADLRPPDELALGAPRHQDLSCAASIQVARNFPVKWKVASSIIAYCLQAIEQTNASRKEQVCKMGQKREPQLTRLLLLVAYS